MLSRLHLVHVRSLKCSSIYIPFKSPSEYLKLQSIFIHCRCKSTSGSKENAISSVKENENSHITIARKVKEATKDAGYLGIIIAGIGVTGIMFYAIFRELFSRQSPNSVYSDALKLCRCDPNICDILGEPIKGYGELSSRGRRRHVSHFIYVKDGKNYIRLKFYVEGIRKSGTVQLEMVEDEKSKYQYRYLFVDIDGYPSRTIVLRDNRHLDGNYDNTQLDLLK